MKSKTIENKTKKINIQKRNENRIEKQEIKENRRKIEQTEK